MSPEITPVHAGVIFFCWKLCWTWSLAFARATLLSTKADGGLSSSAERARLDSLNPVQFRYERF